MAKVVFNTPFNRIKVRPVDAPDVTDPEGQVVERTNVTESAGYRSVEQQINAAIQAGELLMEQRRLVYDFEAGLEVPDDAEDPTRAPNYDLADASMALGAIQARAEAAAAGAQPGAEESSGSGSAGEAPLQREEPAVESEAADEAVSQSP